MKLTDTEILGCYFYTLYRDKCYMKNLDMFIAGMQYTLFSNIFSNPFKVGTDTLEPEAEVLFGILDIMDYAALCELKRGVLSSPQLFGYVPFSRYENDKLVERFWLKVDK